MGRLSLVSVTVEWRALHLPAPARRDAWGLAIVPTGVNDGAMTADEATFPHVDVAVLFAVLGLVLVWAGWAAARGRLKRNYVIGMRTSAIMKSDETWRVAHEKCAWTIWSSGCVLLGAAVLLLGLRPSEAWSVVLLSVATAAMMVLVIVGAVQASRTVDHEAPGSGGHRR